MLDVYIPSVGHQVYKSDKTHTVFKLDVLYNGRRHTLDRRYSEFHTLHKLLKKKCKVPDFPPKRVPNWMSKVQEQRRQGLEAYIQGVLWFNKEVPKELLDFLKVKHFLQSKKNCSLDRFLADTSSGENSSQLAHKAVIGFYKDLYIFPPDTDMLEDIVLQGVIQGLYQQSHKTPPVAKQKLPSSNPVP
ncbi:sorting nexin-22 isoform X1 [Bufo gargarizans]|uniref:sorting nexin-22 isoform X1 n=1 Tax=Bufo gargarizans TaxID=30331 RepID=UPI001CF4998D|nr:sorting nexin-22 isoform X1 [Bufo gargarizans]